MAAASRSRPWHTNKSLLLSHETTSTHSSQLKWRYGRWRVLPGWAVNTRPRDCGETGATTGRGGWSQRITCGRRPDLAGVCARGRGRREPVAVDAGRRAAVGRSAGRSGRRGGRAGHSGRGALPGHATADEEDGGGRGSVQPGEPRLPCGARGEEQRMATRSA